MSLSRSLSRTATLAVALPTLVLALAACGSGSRDDVAVDPAGDSTTPEPSPVAAPTAVPAAGGPVRTRALAIVMDTGTPELCLGPVAESYPPQCGGPEVVGWDWARHGGDSFQQEGDVRWGTYAVTGRWDGTSFEVTEAVPAARHEVAPSPVPEPPAPATTHPPAELQRIAEQVGRLPGAQGAYAGEGQVFVDVLYDDGSLQAWADQEHGAGVVVVAPQLVDAEPR